VLVIAAAAAAAAAAGADVLVSVAAGADVLVTAAAAAAAPSPPLSQALEVLEGMLEGLDVRDDMAVLLDQVGGGHRFDLVCVF
jgi:hypothetical protein